MMAAVILHHRNPITKRPSSIGFCERFIRQFRHVRPRQSADGAPRNAAADNRAERAAADSPFRNGVYHTPPSPSKERRMYHSSLRRLGLIPDFRLGKRRFRGFQRDERVVSKESRSQSARTLAERRSTETERESQPTYPFYSFTPSFPRKRESIKPPILRQVKPSANRNRQIPSPYFTPVIPAKAGIHKAVHPVASETKRESQPTNPFSLYGRRLG